MARRRGLSGIQRMAGRNRLRDIAHGGGSKKGCFVATAAFNNQDHPTVEQLRKIRDLRLAQTRCGREFIHFYYAHGQLLAKVVNQIPSIKPVIRLILTVLAKTLSK